MILVTQHIGPRDKVGIVVGQQLDPCPPETHCPECAAGKVRILARSYYGKEHVRHVEPSYFRFTEVH